jgi:hypothetical protein
VHSCSAPGSAWGSRIALLCSAIFAVAAIGTNAVYGWSRGDNPASSLIWSAVAIAVSAAFTLAWPATMRALSNRDWPAAAMCAVAAVLFGTFSVAGALGAASSGRTTPAVAETDTTAARKRAQAAYDQAQAEIGRLEPSRSVAELIPLVETAKPQCRVRVDGNGSQKVCSKPSALLAELGRAQRRVELQDQIDRATAALATGSVRPANSDSKAVAKYLGAIGIDATAERITDLLVLLAVLVLEFGPGACLTLALALSAQPQTRLDAPDARVQPATPRVPDVSRTPTPPVQVVQDTDVLAPVRAAGGRLQTTMRALGAQVGRPAATVHGELKRLASVGLISLSSNSRGTLISLRAN